jgi:hypothetical protein
MVERPLGHPGELYKFQPEGGWQLCGMGSTSRLMRQEWIGNPANLQEYLRASRRVGGPKETNGSYTLFWNE